MPTKPPPCRPGLAARVGGDLARRRGRRTRGSCRRPSRMLPPLVERHGELKPHSSAKASPMASWNSLGVLLAERVDDEAVRQLGRRRLAHRARSPSPSGGAPRGSRAPRAARARRVRRPIVHLAQVATPERACSAPRRVERATIRAHDPSPPDERSRRRSAVSSCALEPAAGDGSVRPPRAATSRRRDSSAATTPATSASADARAHGRETRSSSSSSSATSAASSRRSARRVTPSGSELIEHLREGYESRRLARRGVAVSRLRRAG